MTALFHVHPDNPQQRLINQVVEVVRAGGIIVYPTDSVYAFGCQIGNKAAMERIIQIRQLKKEHHFSLMCADLSQLGTYAHVSNTVFRLLKAYTPGPYTFILPASHEVPRRLQHPKLKTIGLRIPDNTVALSLLAALEEPLMSVSFMLPDNGPVADPMEIYEWVKARVEMVVDGGVCGLELTTIVDFLENVPKVVRVGKGDPTPFGGA